MLLLGLVNGFTEVGTSLLGVTLLLVQVHLGLDGGAGLGGKPTGLEFLWGLWGTILVTRADVTGVRITEGGEEIGGSFTRRL